MNYLNRQRGLDVPHPAEKGQLRGQINILPNKELKMSTFRGRSDNENANRRGDLAAGPTSSRPMQEIYHVLTGKSYTRQELTETLPIRLIAAFQRDGSLLMGPYSSEWMTKEWAGLVEPIEVRGESEQGERAIIHLAGDNLVGQTPTQAQLHTLHTAAQPALLKTRKPTP